MYHTVKKRKNRWCAWAIHVKRHFQRCTRVPKPSASKIYSTYVCKFSKSLSFFSKNVFTITKNLPMMRNSLMESWNNFRFFAAVQELELNKHWPFHCTRYTSVNRQKLINFKTNFRQKFFYFMPFISSGVITFHCIQVVVARVASHCKQLISQS